MISGLLLTSARMIYQMYRAEKDMPQNQTFIKFIFYSSVYRYLNCLLKVLEKTIKFRFLVVNLRMEISKAAVQRQLILRVTRR